MADLITVRDLKVYLDVDAGTVKAVDGISFRIPAGGTVALVGESGSGKSVVAQSIMGILPRIARIESGEIKFRDPKLGTEVDISRLDPEGRAMQDIRGGRISIIFQEPMTALSPLHTIGNQIGEALALHREVNKRERRDAVIDMLQRVGFPDPVKAEHTYPFELSGGLRQRAMIAMALVCRPALLIADEPTTALDVTIQAQILDLMLELKEKLGSAIILITHDLGVVAETCERVIVMYAGRMVEQATAGELFGRPLHPYTRGLLRALPRADDDGDAGSARPKLAEIPGIVPDLSRPIAGCAFAPRCGFVVDRCRTEAPGLVEAGNSHPVACWEAHRVAEAAA
jgi:peptide/nickel transport system ATP-binding protein